MGASLNDVLFEYQMLWIHTLIYFALACMVYLYQRHLSRKLTLERLEELKQNKLSAETVKG
jgi:ABC-2 type transport system permease protein